jgi:hypothetical protein
MTTLTEKRQEKGCPETMNKKAEKGGAKTLT